MVLIFKTFFFLNEAGQARSESDPATRPNYAIPQIRDGRSPHEKPWYFDTSISRTYTLSYSIQFPYNLYIDYIYQLHSKLVILSVGCRFALWLIEDFHCYRLGYLPLGDLNQEPILMSLFAFPQRRQPRFVSIPHFANQFLVGISPPTYLPQE